MEANCTDLTERLLRLTLEIIYLLTGENNVVVIKTSGDGQDPITVPLHSLLVPERNNEQKILKVTQKIIELLTGESGKWSNINVSIKEEIQEGEEEDGVIKKQECLEEPNNLHKDIMMEDQSPLTSMDGSSNGNPPERCPPLYSRDSTQEDHTIPHHHQGLGVIGIKTEVKQEEIPVRGNQLSMKEAEMTLTITNEESSLDVSTDGPISWNISEGRLVLSAHYNKDDNGMAHYSPGVSIVTPIHHQPNHMVRSTDRFNAEESEHKLCTILPNVQASFHIADTSPELPTLEESSSNSFQECEKSFLVVPQIIDTSEKRYACSECEMSFTKKSHFIQHLRTHSGEKPYACSECEKSFTEKSNLKRHQRIHTGEKPFPCSDCGKNFSDKGNRDRHKKTHSGVPQPEKNDPPEIISQLRPPKNKMWWSVMGFSCEKCGKCFSDKGNYDMHMRTHTAEKTAENDPPENTNMWPLKNKWWSVVG